MTTETNKLKRLANRVRRDLAIEVSHLHDIGEMMPDAIDTYYNKVVPGINKAMSDDNELREAGIVIQRRRHDAQSQNLTDLKTKHYPAMSEPQQAAIIRAGEKQLLNLSKFIDLLT